MLIVGAAELVLPLFQTYATLVVFALVFGTLAGSFIAIMPVGLVTAMIVLYGTPPVSCSNPELPRCRL